MNLGWFDELLTNACQRNLMLCWFGSYRLLPCETIRIGDEMKFVALTILLCLLCAVSVAQVNSYTVTPIVDSSVDTYLINPWGMSRPIQSSITENEWWVS